MPSFVAMTDWSVPVTALTSAALAFLVVLIYREQRRNVRAARLGCRRLLARADLHCSDPEPDGDEHAESEPEQNPEGFPEPRGGVGRAPANNPRSPIRCSSPVTHSAAAQPVHPTPETG